ncbi:protein CEPU-1-like [Ostrea edulis]|uniref:protein CEPU-1-like n=1 Tax=Ostrea edulis TaxID=37623 RepID=UPI0024AF041B|nr:protein CEPU-1-like [Ostrea edulis]
MADDLVGWIVLSLTILRKGAFALEPSFDVPVINITVVVGKTAILPCSVEFLGEHKVVWTDEFSTLLTFDINRIIDDDRIGIDRPYNKDWNLIIHDVRVKDRGRYICQINTHPIKTKPVELNVLVPPQILNENDDGSRREILSKEGETVNVICNVSGIPPPSVKWYRRPLEDTLGSKKERIVSELDRPKDRQREPCIYTVHDEPGIGMEGEILVIHNVSRYCDGIYQCVASNDVPPAVEMETAVFVEFQPEVNLINKRISQEKGKETILLCEITAFPQALSYWMYHGQEVVSSERFKVDIYPEGKAHTITLSLRITNISEIDFGEYECFASNKLGRDRESMVLNELRKMKVNKQTTPAVVPPTTRSRQIVGLVATYRPTHARDEGESYKGLVKDFQQVENGCQSLNEKRTITAITLFFALLLTSYQFLNQGGLPTIELVLQGFKMSSIRSSVHPKDLNQPWGTILKPEYGLGHQKMTDYEIDQTVDRLYKIPATKERVYERPGKKMTEEEIAEMLQRLTKAPVEKIPDSDRRVTKSTYNEMGVVSSYAWKGYN